MANKPEALVLWKAHPTDEGTVALGGLPKVMQLGSDGVGLESGGGNPEPEP